MHASLTGVPASMLPSEDPAAIAMLNAFQAIAYERVDARYPRFSVDEGVEFMLNHPLIQGHISTQREEARSFIRSQYETFANVTPTPLQHFGTYEIILRLYYALMVKYDATSPQGLRRPQPVIGTQPLGSVNGRAIVAEGVNAPIVILDDGVFAFAHLSSKVMGPALSHLARPAVNGNGLDVASLHVSLIPNELPADSIRDCVDLFLAYIINGHPFAAPARFADASWVAVSAYFRDAAEFFILAHELGHIALQHHGQKQAIATRICPPGADFVGFEWQDEWEADNFGCELTLGLLVDGGAPPQFAFLTIDVFLTWLSYVDLAVGIFKYGKRCFRLSTSHPPMVARRDRLRKMFINSVPTAMVGEAIDVATAIEALIGKVFRVVEQELISKRGQGVKASPIWDHFDTES